MADKSKIEWTDATWNPITGCSMVSPGCTNCYAMTLAGGRLKHHPSREGLTTPTERGPVWNGEVRFNAKWLDQPLKWKKPRRIFVCAHSDLFNEDVPDEWIDLVFSVMALAPQHTFQVLTKRDNRMRAYCSSEETIGRLTNEITRFSFPDILTFRHKPDGLKGIIIPNVWLGVSVESEQHTKRIENLLDTPAAVRFVSVEPLLGPVTLDSGIRGGPPRFLSTEIDHPTDTKLDWVICGGESGKNARPMLAPWARDIRDECIMAGVPFHFKQWGEWDARLRKVGKKKAGRILDGRTWDELPGENA